MVQTVLQTILEVFSLLLGRKHSEPHYNQLPFIEHLLCAGDSCTLSLIFLTIALNLYPYSTNKETEVQHGELLGEVSTSSTEGQAWV